MYRFVPAQFRVDGRRVGDVLPVLVIIPPKPGNLPPWFGSCLNVPASMRPSIARARRAKSCELAIAGLGAFPIKISAIDPVAIRFNGRGPAPRLDAPAGGAVSL